MYSLDKSKYNDLVTPYEGKESEIPYSEYPRPSFRRESYYSLNGRWSLCVKRGEAVEYSGEITVPYPPESRLSGVERITEAGDTLYYERTFTLPEGFNKGRVLLHFGGCDNLTKVYLNGKPVGEHEGGYLPFTFDITEALQGENRLLVEITDALDLEYPYGKQRHKRGGMWYTPISGIWQSVWCESVPDGYVESVRITPTLTSVHFEVRGGAEEKCLTVDGREYTFMGDEYTLSVDDPVLWSPEEPNLYEFTLTSGDDRVESYFALRTVEIKDGRICLNGEPYYLHGVLDQGYFSDGIYLPATPEGYKDDVLRMKECGFNTLRKHIKVEPELFYYYCDRYGMIVLQDMVNSGKYNFIIDTALPTIGFKRGITHRASQKRRESFYKCADGMMEHLYNHPSVCYYTIFNEGWGQFDADGNYKRFKAKDPTRIYDTTSGWFKEKLSDVESDHVYFKAYKVKKRSEHPRVLSEYGGFSCRVTGHCYNPGKTYGYSTVTEDTGEFESAVIKAFDESVLPNIKNGLNGDILTQLSDVEDEINGLITYDRQVLKVDPDKMKAKADEIYNAFKNS